MNEQHLPYSTGIVRRVQRGTELTPLQRRAMRGTIISLVVILAELALNPPLLGLIVPFAIIYLVGYVVWAYTDARRESRLP